MVSRCNSQLCMNFNIGCRRNGQRKAYRVFINYFINKDKKHPERIYNLSPKKRDNEKANFRRLVKLFNVKKNGTLYHGDVEAVTRDRVLRILKFVLGVYKFLGRYNTLILMFNNRRKSASNRLSHMPEAECGVVDYTHCLHLLLLLSPKADTHLTVPRRVEG